MKDSCSPILELLEKYLDEEVTEHERTLVEDHLLECRACQDELTSMKELHTLITLPVDGAVQQENFPWVWQKIERRLQTEEKPSWLQSLWERLESSPLLRRRVWAPALAAALIVILVAVPLLMKKTSSPSEASVVVYVESQTNNVMIYESESDQNKVAVIWLLEGSEEESPIS